MTPEALIVSALVVSNTLMAAAAVHLSFKNNQLKRDLNCATHDRNWLRQDNEQLRRKLIHANHHMTRLHKQPAAKERQSPTNREPSKPKKVEIVDGGNHGVSAGISDAGMLINSVPSGSASSSNQSSSSSSSNCDSSSSSSSPSSCDF